MSIGIVRNENSQARRLGCYLLQNVCRNQWTSWSPRCMTTTPVWCTYHMAWRWCACVANSHLRPCQFSTTAIKLFVLHSKRRSSNNIYILPVRLHRLLMLSVHSVCLTQNIALSDGPQTLLSRARILLEVEYLQRRLNVTVLQSAVGGPSHREHPVLVQQ